MTVDLYDNVLMPFTIGLLVILGFLAVGYLLYVLVTDSLIAFIVILIILVAWAIGFPIWRKYRYG